MTRWTRRGVLAAGLAAGASAPGWAQASCAAAPEGALTRWVMWPDLPLRTQEIYPGVLDGTIYLAGGLSPDAAPDALNILDTLFIFETRGADGACAGPGGAWREGARLPEPRHHPNLVGHGDRVFAIGGFHASQGGRWGMLANTTAYDPAADSWTEMAPMPAPYGETVAASLNGAIHLATGRQPNGEANSEWTDHGDRAAHYVYDPAEDRWREAAPNPTPRNSAAGAVLDGRLHVVGGRRVNAGNNTEHEAYDPATDSWESRAPLPQGQGGLAAAAAGGLLYAFGGEFFGPDGGGVYPQCWIYDPQADAWSAGPDMRTPRHGLGGVSIDGVVYAIAGATAAGGNGTSTLVEALIPSR